MGSRKIITETGVGKYYKIHKFYILMVKEIFKYVIKM